MICRFKASIQRATEDDPAEYLVFHQECEHMDGHWRLAMDGRAVQDFAPVAEILSKAHAELVRVMAAPKLKLVETLSDP